MQSQRRHQSDFFIFYVIAMLALLAGTAKGETIAPPAVTSTTAGPTFAP